MIEKIISIRNIGQFRDCTPRGDVTFRKLNLLFAENGRGKTTLCAILRSLQTGLHEFISERKTLGATDPAFVQIRIEGNTVTFGKKPGHLFIRTLRFLTPFLSTTTYMPEIT